MITTSYSEKFEQLMTDMLSASQGTLNQFVKEVVDDDWGDVKDFRLVDMCTKRAAELYKYFCVKADDNHAEFIRKIEWLDRHINASSGASRFFLYTLIREKFVIYELLNNERVSLGNIERLLREERTFQ